MLKKTLPLVGLVLSAALALLFLYLTVAELIPPPTSALEVSEAFAVSASQKTADKENPVYVCQLRGTLFNPTAETISYTEITVRIDAPGGGATSVTLDATVPARDTQEIFLEWESATPYDRVTGILAKESDGSVTEIRAADGIGWIPVCYGVLTLLCALLTVYFVKQQLYAAEEGRAKRSCDAKEGQ